MKFFSRTEFRIFATVFLILFFYASQYGGSYMADSMLATTQAVIDKGSFAIDDYVKPGCINTTSKSLYGCDHAFYKGHWYSGFPPGASFLALPAYLILKPFMHFIPEFIYSIPKMQVQLVLLNLLSTILIAIPLSALVSVLLHKFNRKFTKSRKIRIISSLLFSFGTIFFFYSTTFDARILGAFFSFASFYILFLNKLRGAKPFWLFIAGFFAMLAVAMEYMQVVIAIVLTLYLFSFLRNKKIVYYFLGAIVPLMLLLSYHYFVFDSPFKTGYGFRQGADAGLAENTFGNFDISHIWDYTFSPKYGLFFYMPVLLLCVYGLFAGLIKKKKYRVEFLAALLAFIGYMSFIALFKSESVCTFGPRYFIALMPFLCIGLSTAIENLNRAIVFVFGAVSVFINYLAVLYVVGPIGCVPGFGVFRELTARIFQKGLTSYTFNLINQILMPLNYLWVNIANIIILGLIGLVLWRVWKH